MRQATWFSICDIRSLNYQFAYSLFAILLMGLVYSNELNAQSSKPESESPSSPGTFQAGVATVDATPTNLPAILAGGFLEAQSSTITDRLYVRAFVLDDGHTKIALTVVDTCMMPQTLIDSAKEIASKSTGIPTTHIMVSATHTHSAPAAMGCLGTRQDKAYAAELPAKIAEAIEKANANLVPARIGWSSIDDWSHTHNRRWIRKPESKIVDPFGEATGLAHMHPGYQSRDVIGPSGPVDPALSVISLQTADGRPLGVFANYSQHYFGSGGISSDYYGLFCKYVAELVKQPGEGNGPFVCAMSQGTSGDLMWMDYGVPAKSIDLARYAEAVAVSAEKAISQIQYRDTAEIAMEERTLPLNYRVPDAKRLEWARPIVAKIENDLPKSIPEVYANEAIILHERQKTSVKLQAIRIGDLTIATLPNEVYALTGLKLRGRTPGTHHFNIELANGAEGYIPPPEQHHLGGYTTWPARTAGLEVSAEMKIVDELVDALEKVAGQPRREMKDEHGPYSLKVIDHSPYAYWRLNDEDGDSVRNAVSGERAKLSPGYAFFLPGVASGTGTGAGETLTTSAFCGNSQINRAIHFAGGSLVAEAEALTGDYSVALWFWLGEPSGASDRVGELFRGKDGTTLIARQFANHEAQLEIDGVVSSARFRADDWNFVVLVRSEEQLRVHVNGIATPVLVSKAKSKANEEPIRFGAGLQGKLDEIAVFNRELAIDSIVELWQISGVAEQRASEELTRVRLQRDKEARIKPPVFAEDYQQAISGLNPVQMLQLTSFPEGWRLSGVAGFSPRTFANFGGGRLEGSLANSSQSYTVSLWFRNEVANEARPVTAYLFSRGPDGDAMAPGDHLGIGGTYRGDLTGRLIVFNGNAKDYVVAGRTIIEPETWNHAVFVRDGNRVRVYLNGEQQPEIDSEVEPTFGESTSIFLGARNDQFAPLQGNLAWVSIFDRALPEEQSHKLHSSSGQKVGAPELPPARIIKPASEPLSAEESLKKIHVPDRFQVELVASEPQVIDPVAFDWDAGGRLWVVEMSDYPLGMDGNGKPGGRVRVLEDLDRDGVYEKGTIFADGIGYPNGILTWRDGVLVTAAPQLLFLRDKDGDGIADEKEVLFEGFNEGNQQLRMNHLRWGLDNWVYCANGGHHPNHGLGTKVVSHRNGKEYEVGSRDFRFRPDTGELELESGPSQFGRNRDAWGHWFGTQNASPLWHYVLPDRYLARNPYVPTQSAIQHIVGPGSPPVYPASSPEKRFHSFEQSGRFTSACSGMIYGDVLLFGKEPVGHAFTCEPFHNVVQHNLIFDQGVSYVSARPENEGQFDFFASEDRWCRPVMVRTGPDGALWVADMYRYMIEHPDWLPAEGKSELLPHYRLGDDRGRIYRVYPASGKPSKDWQLDKHSPAQLVNALNSTNSWVRDKAQQLLVWSQDRTAVHAIEEIARNAPLAEARVQALYVLSGLNALTPKHLIAACKDSHPRVRENAIRLAESFNSFELLKAVALLARDPDDKVCLQLALSAGQWTDRALAEALLILAVQYHENPFFQSAILSSTRTHGEAFASGIVNQQPAVFSAFREPLVRQAIGTSDYSLLAKLLQGVLRAKGLEQFNSIDQFMQTLQSVGVDLHEFASKDDQKRLDGFVKRLDALIQDAERVAKNESEQSSNRLAATRLLCRIPEKRDSGVELLANWLQPQTPIEDQNLAIEVLAQSGSSGVTKVLANAWPVLGPSLREKAIDAWLSRETWTVDLLGRIEQKEITPTSLSLQQRSRLLQHPSPEIAQRSAAVFAQLVSATRKQVLEAYRSSLELSGNAQRGEAVYAKSCASCHKRGKEGYEVGPNLASVINHSNEKLLTNILDPNVDIQPGFQVYTVLLESGEILSGLLANETANSITIKQASGVSKSIARQEIERLQTTNLSFMPEGLEANVSPQEMADLIEFLQSPIE